MYAGLTTADKGALLKAKECGGSTYSRWSTIGNEWVRELTVNIDLALAQIAEMESALSPVGCAYCTSDELQGYALEIVHGKYPKIIGLSNKGVVCKEQSAFAYCPNCGRNLNSPHTEGETK